MKDVLFGAAAALCITVGVCIFILTGKVMEVCDQTRATERAIAEAANTIPAIANTIPAMKTETLAKVDGLEKMIEKHLGKIESIAAGQLGAANRTIATLADAGASELPIVRSSLIAGMAGIQADIHGVTAELQPVLDHAAAVSAHAEEASAILLRRDALPAQILGTLGAAKVTLGETAQTMRTIRDAAPDFVRDSHEIAGHIKAVAADAHREVDKLTAPEPWWRHVLDYMETAAVTAARIF